MRRSLVRHVRFRDTSETAHVPGLRAEGQPSGFHRVAGTCRDFFTPWSRLPGGSGRGSHVRDASYSRGGAVLQRVLKADVRDLRQRVPRQRPSVPDMRDAARKNRLNADQSDCGILSHDGPEHRAAAGHRRAPAATSFRGDVRAAICRRSGVRNASQSRSGAILQRLLKTDVRNLRLRIPRQHSHVP